MMKPDFSRRRLGVVSVAGLALVAAVLLVGVLPGQALAPSTFEIDGNLVLNNSANKDWCTNFPAPVSPTLCTTKVTNFVSQEDVTPRADDNSFGNGTKEDTAVPSVVTGSIPPNKSDLSRFYVANESVGGKAFMYLAWERFNTLGSANMDFEFNKSSTLSSNGVTPVRSPGDILITFDFSQGGSTVNLSLLKWVTSGANSQCEAGGATTADGCWGNKIDLDAAAEAEGKVNDGFTTYDPIKGETEVSNGFGEAAINLTDALDLGPGDCTAFGSGYLKSRSSDSFTAAAKDFVPPKNVNISLCQPATVKVKKLDARDGTSGLPGAVFELYRNDGTNTAVLDAGDHLLSTCTTNATGDCTFSPDVTGEGTVSLLVHEKTAPAGFSGAPDQIFSVTFGTSAQTITRTFSDSPVPGTVNIHKQDDSGNPLAGAEFTLYTDNAPIGPADGAGPNQDSHGVEDVATALKCSTNAAGDCTIASVPLGRYWVVETVTPAGYSTAGDKYANITLGSNPNQGTTISLTFVDPVVKGTINIHKQDDAGAALQGAEFTLYTDASPFGPADGAGPNQDSHGGEDTATSQKCTTNASGDCTISNVPIGRYWVVETVTPAGYSTASDKYASVVLGGLPNQGTTISLTFVDPIVKGTVNIHKTDDASNALQGAEFTLYTDASPFGPADGAGPNQDAHGGEDTATSLKCTTSASGDCSIASVPIGKYWVVETVTPNGYETAGDKYADITVGSQANQGTTISLSFVDPRQHKVIVIVCHQGTNTLHSSSVTIDGVTKQSLSTAPATIPEDTLCKLGGAQYGGLAHGAHSGTVDIPSH
jgi:hypothetical protein